MISKNTQPDSGAEDIKEIFYFEFFNIKYLHNNNEKLPPPYGRNYRHLTGVLKIGILCFLFMRTSADFSEVFSFIFDNTANCCISP